MKEYLKENYILKKDEDICQKNKCKGISKMIYKDREKSVWECNECGGKVIVEY